MFFHGFFPQSFIVISPNLPANFSWDLSRLYWIGMVMLVNVLYDNLRRGNVHVSISTQPLQSTAL